MLTEEELLETTELLELETELELEETGEPVQLPKSNQTKPEPAGPELLAGF